MVRTWSMLALAGVVLLPAAADAQKRSSRVVVQDYRYRNPWSMEPYAGAFRDAYDLTGIRTGYLLGLRIGYIAGSRWRLNGNVGYNETRDVAYSPVPASVQYDNQWVLTTAGAEFDVVPGRTSGSIGLNAGAGWRRVRAAGTLPPPGESLASDGFSAYDVLVPSVTLRHRISNRAALTARFEDYMFDVLEGPTDHSLAFSIGVAFR